MSIPVFHDDQHGTAIIVGAALVNALQVVGKPIASVRLAVSGAGAAGIACLDMLVALGVAPQNILVTDKDGVLHTGRADLQPGGVNEGIVRYARDTSARSLAEIVTGADVFLGVSAGNVLKPAMVETMAAKPVMEGKGVLFQKFAGIDVFDLEIAERDPDKLVDIIDSL